MSEATAPGGGILGYTDFVEVGRGGFGTVYRAHEAAFNRSVAIKVLAASKLGGDAAARLERECRAMGALSGHPHIVSVYGSGQTVEGRPYIVMEYVAGGSLARRPPMAWEQVLDLGVKLAGALESAHQAGVIHRDVKPENVLLSAYGEPKLADFGVAKVSDSSETPSGLITASLLHAAPETLSGERPSPVTDVYSLASTLFTLLAGMAPFARTGEETLAPLITRICVEDPPDLRGRGVPDEVARALEAGLGKDADQRPRTAAAFGELLRSVQSSLGLAVTPLLVGPAVEAPAAPVVPPSVAERTTAPVAAPAAASPASASPAEAPARSRRGLVTVAASVAAALVVAAIGYAAVHDSSEHPLDNVAGTSGHSAVTRAPSGSPKAAPSSSKRPRASASASAVPVTSATEDGPLPGGSSSGGGRPAPHKTEPPVVVSKGGPAADTTAPTVSVPTKDGQVLTSTDRISFSFSGADAGGLSGFECKDPGSSSWVACSSPRTYTEQVNNAQYSFAVRSVDKAGNKSASTTRSWTLRVTAWNGRLCTVLGTPGSDTVTGTRGDDVLCGLGGDDVVRPSGGNVDYVDGGTGTDTVSYDGYGQALSINLDHNDVSNLDQSGKTKSQDFLHGFENARGTGYGDVIYGRPGGASVIEGMGGNDSLYASATGFVMRGGSGTDKCYKRDFSYTGSYSSCETAPQ